ncbi:MAG TPA: hypothetical protein VMT12_11130 [Syntrophales bacterium]|nr:hypothetical protein [Syntrophales bacterium]
MSNNKLALYNKYKDDMKTGDLLQWQSNVWYKRLWRWVTHSKVEHSSMVLRLQEYQGPDKRRFILESRDHGTVLNLLSKRLEEFDGEVKWYPLDDTWHPYRKRTGEEMLKMIGRPYNFAGFVKLTLRHAIGVKCRKILNKTVLKWFVDWVNQVGKREVFCSEYCYLAYEATGHMRFILTDPPSPDDMMTLKIFKDGKKIL